MGTEQRRRTDLLDPVPPPSGDRGHLAALLLVTVLGMGVGLLAAPQTGADTRRALRKRLAALGEDLGEDLEDLEERSRPLRRKVREQAEDLGRRGRKKYEQALEELEALRGEDEEEGSAVLATALTLGAGFAAAYFLTSDRAAPARERVREVAATFRDEAESRWDNFQRRRGNGHKPGESGIRIDPADSAPQAS